MCTYTYMIKKDGSSTFPRMVFLNKIDKKKLLSITCGISC